MSNDILEKAVEYLKVNKGKERYKWYKILMETGKNNPEELYTYSRQIGEALKSEKPDILYTSIYLTAFISKKKLFFESVFDDYINLLSHESVVVAPHASKLLSIIVMNNPEFENKITPILLNLHCLSRCSNNELLKAYTVMAFNGYYPISEFKEDILNYVKLNSQSKRPTMKKACKDFFKNHC